jgi:hypothetical protein
LRGAAAVRDQGGGAGLERRGGGGQSNRVTPPQTGSPVGGEPQHGQFTKDRNQEWEGGARGAPLCEATAVRDQGRRQGP